VLSHVRSNHFTDQKNGSIQRSSRRPNFERGENCTSPRQYHRLRGRERQPCGHPVRLVWEERIAKAHRHESESSTRAWKVGFCLGSTGTQLARSEWSKLPYAVAHLDRWRRRVLGHRLLDVRLKIARGCLGLLAVRLRSSTIYRPLEPSIAPKIFNFAFVNNRVLGNNIDWLSANGG
jgi:hypothetical protein